VSVSEAISFDELIRDLLLALVSSQTQANKDFITSLDDLAATNIAIGYKKNTGDKTEKREITGNALAFGITPVLLQIQSGVIEIKTALSVTKNTTSPSNGSGTSNVKGRAGFLFKAESVDAKYQNTYSYKAEFSSTIRITVVPTPAPQSLLDAIKALTEASPAIDSVKK
jgi:hypothetical protein